MARATPRIGFLPASAKRSTASFRLRADKPARFLRQAGWHAEVIDAKGAPDHDVVVFQKAYEQAHLDLAASLVAQGKRVVFDLCDNHLANSRNERATRVRAMFEIATDVTVSSDYLRTVFGVGTVIPDALESVPEFVPLLAAARRRLRRGRSLRLTWCGNAGDPQSGWGMTGLDLLDEHWPAILRSYPDTTLTIVSNDRTQFRVLAERLAVRTRYQRWSQLKSLAAIALSDVTIIPAVENPFTWAKTTNRVATAVRVGVPVVASPIPSYKSFESAILFESWADSIVSYRSNAELAVEHITAGRSLAKMQHGRDAVVSAWTELLAS